VFLVFDTSIFFRRQKRYFVISTYFPEAIIRQKYKASIGTRGTPCLQI